MEIIGFLFTVGLALYIVAGAAAMTAFSIGFTGTVKKDQVVWTCFLLFVAAALLFYAWGHSPFEIHMRVK